MFEKTLVDVVKGIRSCKRDTALYISQCIAEIKAEINSTDIHVKANALQKITFLQMMGYNMNWSNFTAIEVMSSPKFAHKRIGYLAACQGFHQHTDVILLTTNLLQKELRGAVCGSNMTGVYEAGLAINCVSNIVTEDLARDLLPELTQLMKHSQPYLRKKTVLCLFKLFVKYPQALRLTFEQLQQCLDDSNPSVVSCAVNVITELSDKNPKNYLHLAPAFFQLLTSSSNNWMLIKVVKLLGSLVPEEPRLARKLLEPLAHIVETTQAKSLLYEATHTITLCLPYCRKKSDGSMPASAPRIVTLCAETLKSFVEEEDQNLKYLGLVGFAQLMKSYPKVLVNSEYRPLILQCLSDDDITIRTRALDLLKGMTTPRNLMELITQLCKHVDICPVGPYKNDLIAKIVELCHQDKYANIQDFTWYLDVLIDLGHTMSTSISHENALLLKSQLEDVTLRVLPVRTYAVRRCMEILMEDEIRHKLALKQQEREASGGNGGGGGDQDSLMLDMEDPNTAMNVQDNGRGKHIMVEILPAVAWIVGEYSDLIREATELQDDDDDEEDELELPTGMYHSMIHAMLVPSSNYQKLCPSTQSIYVQSAVKIFAAACADTQIQDSELEACVETMTRYIPIYMESTSVEVKERAHTLVGLLNVLNIVDGSTATGGGPMPALTSIDNDNEDSSSSEEEEEEADMDLLALGGITTTGTTTKKKKPKKAAKSNPVFGTTSSSSSIASKCRSAAQMLKNLLKPEPMKPISIKTQLKKRRHPMGVSVDVLDTPVNMSVFEQMFETTASDPKSSKNYLTIESVSFTQQRPIRTHVPDRTGISSSNAAAPGAGGDDVSSLGSGAVSFQQQGGFGDTSNLNRGGDGQQDPFYLPSSGGQQQQKQQEEQQKQGQGGEQSKFGSIQLLDIDDEEDYDNMDGGKKKKKKKDKRRKNKNGTAKKGAFTVYNSDDDEDDDYDDTSTLPSLMNSGNNKADNPFAALSQVDLTTPLGAHEVMPERKHHVVAERPPPAAATPAAGGSSTTKKKKKKKESKKKEPKKNKSSKQMDTSTANAAVPGMEGDLLGFGGGGGGGGFSAMTTQPSATSASAPGASLSSFMPSSTTVAPTASGGDAISSAFGDLLSLEAPLQQQSVPAPTSASNLQNIGNLSMAQPSASTTAGSTTSGGKKSSKKPWMKATLKTSDSSGSSFVAWDSVLVTTRATPENGNAASIKIRVVNNSNTPLNNVTIKLKGGSSNSVVIGTVNPSSSVESSKVGPFSCEKDVVKGTMCVSGDSTVPVKIALPATLHLSPVSGLTLDDILTQMSSGSWSSHSATLPIESSSSGVGPKKVKALLCNFFQASEVEGDSSANDLTGTLAAKSDQNGAQVRILVKVSTSSVKVDVKCTDKDLCKALISSLKKLVL